MKKTPHGDKLRALFDNPKLPKSDADRKHEVMQQYERWRTILSNDSIAPRDYLTNFTSATNEYKKFIDFDFTFKSEGDFLYRQKGQLKLDNTILEEALPYLVNPVLVPGAFRKSNTFIGDVKCFAGLYFGSWNATDSKDRFSIKSKDQDLAVGKTVAVKIKDGMSEDNLLLHVAHFAAELKTNLDKTMYQEASATAAELKKHVHKSTYLLICEWLDMTPIDSSTSSIDNVIVLRKAKRLSSNVRSRFSTLQGRREKMGEYERFLDSHPIQVDMIEFIVSHMNKAMPLPDESSEEDRLDRGYF